MARKTFDASKAAGKQEGYTNYHYTPETAVIDLLKFIPFQEGDLCLDPSAGVNKVWYNNFPCQKVYCEIDEGTNFFEYPDKVDWIVGNPPFTEFVKFLMHSPNIARKGFAYLIGHSRVNQVTPNRLSKLEAEGFYLSGIQIVSIKAWFGRYYFLIFSRSKNEGIGYSTKNYSDEPLRRRTRLHLTGLRLRENQSVLRVRPASNANTVRNLCTHILRNFTSHHPLENTGDHRAFSSFALCVKCNFKP